jgi:G6PDH family F420-dependent oxidoreductase
MLEEAVDVIRQLWNGEFVTFEGKHYTVEHARIYTMPDQPPPIYLSGFGPKATQLAARIGDGYISTMPDKDMLSLWRESGGGDKPTQAGYKVCWGTDDDAAVATAHRLWANSGLPGELSQVLPSPKHFEQASELVSEDMTRDSIAYGADLDRHLDAFRPYAEAGYDEIYISQMGGRERETDVHGFFDFYRDHVLPKLRA